MFFFFSFFIPRCQYLHSIYHFSFLVIALRVTPENIFTPKKKNQESRKRIWDVKDLSAFGRRYFHFTSSVVSVISTVLDLCFFGCLLYIFEATRPPTYTTLFFCFVFPHLLDFCTILVSLSIHSNQIYWQIFAHFSCQNPF